MVCTSCGQRQGRRRCPALGRDICSVCCGTKRQVEINCPPDCRYFTTAQAHPPAVVRRRQEDDLRVLLPTLRDLTEQQGELMWNLLTFLRGHRDDGLLRTTDPDVQDMAEAFAGTYETAASGLIYERRPSSLPAQRLAAEMKAFLSELSEEGRPPRDRDLAAVFRAIAAGAREARKTLPGGDTAYLELVRRMIVPSQAGPRGDERVVTPTGPVLIRP